MWEQVTLGLPAAEVVDVGPDWLLTREVVGRTGADPWPVHQRLKVVDALADITRTLHALPVAAVAGGVDLEDLDLERQGWSAQELVTHGD